MGKEPSEDRVITRKILCRRYVLKNVQRHKMAVIK